MDPTLILSSQSTQDPPPPSIYMPSSSVDLALIHASQSQTDKPITTLTTNNIPITPHDKLIFYPSSLTLLPVSRLKLRQSKHYIIMIRPIRHSCNTQSRYSYAAELLPYIQPLHLCDTVIYLATGYFLEYRHLARDSDKPLWTTSFVNKLGRLAQDVGTQMPTGTNIIHFIARKSVPVHRSVTYGGIITTVRPTNAKNIVFASP